MLIILRLIFGGALFWALSQAIENANRDPMGGDIANAGWLVLCIVFGIANAIVWAPFIGAQMAQTLTGTITESTFVERTNFLLKFVYWLQAQRWKRLTAFFCFFEGIHHPERPTAFVIGMKNATPGSWLQKIYAQQVFKFENTQNCIEAFKILKQFGIDPRPHRTSQVTLALQEIDRPTRPDPEVLPVPKAIPPPLGRNPKIRLFDPPETPNINPDNAKG